ncbi:poly(A)-specific ribonuclease [Sparganum proliferum]
MDTVGLVTDQQSQPFMLDDDCSQFYRTGGYWLMATQTMNGLFPISRIGGIAFDPCEELTWCVTRTGQLTAFYGNTLEPYVTTPVSPANNHGPPDVVPPEPCELRQIIPSPRLDEHVVYILGNDALYVYSKFGRQLGFATDPSMQAMECMAACSSTNTGLGGLGGDDYADFDRFFCGGLQNQLLELDGRGQWGQVVRSINVGDAGCVILEPFALGLCAANTCGQVKIIDPRSALGVVRQIDAHTGEISDMSVMNNGYTLVTCGWSRLADSSLRMDRLANVYDLRIGRTQAGMSSLVDPSLLSYSPALPNSFIVASQTGSFQTLEWGGRNLSAENVGNLLLGYDRLDSMCQSRNGQCLLFATEMGSLHLYSTDLHSCRFNLNPMPTTFASPFAEGLNPIDMSPPPAGTDSAEFPPTANAAIAYRTGRMLNRVAKAAAASIDLQVFGASLYQPAGPLTGVASSLDHLLRLAEHKKMLAVPEALAVALKPVDYDDEEFTFSSLPFLDEPPLCEPAELSEWVCTVTGSRRDGFTSDWPPDLCGDRSRKMLPPDPKVLAQANQKGIGRKPSFLGPVWYPYEPLTFSPDFSDFGPLGCPKRQDSLSHVDQMVKMLGGQT